MSRVIKEAIVKNEDHFISLRRTFTVANEIESDLPDKDTADSPLSPDPSIILENARLEAERLLAEARSEAARILEQARQDGEQLVDETVEQARQNGYTEGLQTAESEAAAIRQQASEVLHQTEVIRANKFVEMEQEIISLAVEIAEKIVGAQLTVQPEIVNDIAREAIAMVKDRKEISLYVSAADANIFLERKNELQQVLGGNSNLNIIIDNSVRAGGCLVETEQGRVDAALDTRWANMMKALFARE